MIHALYIHGGTGDTFRNLAVEERLLETIPDGVMALFTWQSDNAVVIGRHQNPWLETDGEFMARNNITLARRISGGGAVYQDRGNLNFSFIGGRERYDVDLQLRAVVESLARFGLKPVVDGRGGLYLAGRKFSGSSFSLKRGRAMHHGTLLVNTDLEMMRSLRGRMAVGSGAAVLSRPSGMINLAEMNPSITAGGLASALRESWEKVSGIRLSEADAGELCEGPGFRALLEKQGGWEWRYGNTPPCDIRYETAFGALSLRVEKGRVGAVTLLPGGEVLLDARGRVRFEPDELSGAFMNSGDPRLYLIGDCIFSGGAPGCGYPGGETKAGAYRETA